MKVMLERFELEELGESFLANGFFRQEPLAAYADGPRLIVLEGNRRLAALRLVVDGPAAWGCVSRDFTAMHELYHELAPAHQELLQKPIVAGLLGRRDAVGFIGFRHVTGVKTWPALEKAGFIAALAEEHKMSAAEIAKAVGSRPTYVYRHYRAYRMVMQAREGGWVNTSLLERSFGVFMRALQTANVSQFIDAKLPDAIGFDRQPLKETSRVHFAELVTWLFGTNETPPLITDSRKLTEFGKVLGSTEALEYLRNARAPSFEKAYHLAGGEEEEAREAMKAAEYSLRDATPHARSQRDNRAFTTSLAKCADYLAQMLTYHPEIRAEFFSNGAR